MGLLLVIEGFFLFLSFFVSLFYSGPDNLSLLLSGLSCALPGAALALIFRKAEKQIGKREGYIIVSIVWLVFSFFGAIPFYISGYIPNYTDAFFETISGFTTTGASILTDIEALPQGLLFWRSLTQWLGGMGIIVLSLAILPVFGIGGMQLFAAEVPGLTPDKLHPRVKETAKRLWGIYILFTLIQTILLIIGGMGLFDAVNHSFTTMATGGYSTKNTSIFEFSPYIQYVITLFMFLAGVNFTLSYFALKGKFKPVFKNDEFRFYLLIIGVSTLVISLGLIFGHDMRVEKAFRDSLFQVVSIITTTGFATADYLQWSPLLVVLIFLLMFVGGSAGSTGGGPKVVRMMLLLKNSQLELKRLVHPTAVIPVRLNGKAVQPEIVTNVYAFIVLYFIVFLLGVLGISALGLDLNTSMGAVIACLGNIGPGIGDVGPVNNFSAIPTAGKWILSFLMLVGRLELFTVLVLFSRSFWTN